MKNVVIVLLLVPVIAFANGRLETKVQAVAKYISARNIAFEHAPVPFPVFPRTFSVSPGNSPVLSGTFPVSPAATSSASATHNPCELRGGIINSADLQPQDPDLLEERIRELEELIKNRQARSAQKNSPARGVAAQSHPGDFDGNPVVATSPCKPGYVLDTGFNCCVIDFSLTTDTSIDLP